MKAEIVNLIITGRYLALPAIWNIQTQITVCEKNISNWGWSSLIDVANFINDERHTMNLPRISHEKLSDLQFIFDDFGLLNGHDHEGHPLVTWINSLHHVIMGHKPTELIEYDMGIYIPSGWVGKIREALRKGVVRVYVENKKTLLGQSCFDIVGEKLDGNLMDIVTASSSVYFLPRPKNI